MQNPTCYSLISGVWATHLFSGIGDGIQEIFFTCIWFVLGTTAAYAIGRGLEAFFAESNRRPPKDKSQ